jgi:hypothetical protein
MLPFDVELVRALREELDEDRPVVGRAAVRRLVVRGSSRLDER